jgi:hypothetical protein
MSLRGASRQGNSMILRTMNDLPGHEVTELENVGQEICAYGTAVKIRRADTPSLPPHRHGPPRGY